ncbi:hypothetical protein Lser_V15G01045 [Lactuca serriola]
MNGVSSRCFFSLSISSSIVYIYRRTLTLPSGHSSFSIGLFYTISSSLIPFACHI